MPPLFEPPRDHGGNLDAARLQFGGTPEQWLDLSTGINPVPYPVTDVPFAGWTRLPDATAQDRLLTAARQFWSVPDSAAILAAPGASSLIARIPSLAPAGTVHITAPTYNEHQAAFVQTGWQVTDQAPADARVFVHPNNPDGRLFHHSEIADGLTIIDESFCDVCPDQSLVAHAAQPGVIILKSFGKFWGLAGIRLGFAIGDPKLIDALAQMLGPWPVSGPALHVGTQALSDDTWAQTTRTRLAQDRKWLDKVMVAQGALVRGGTDLFGLYAVDDAPALQQKLARAHVWTRIFPYSKSLVRLGLPPAERRSQLETAL